jgi:serine/threonine protein kinase
MPPELLLSGQMSRAVDVYSWGVVVWEMYQGHRPYAGLSHSQVLHAVGMGRLLELPADMPAPLKDLLAAAMARDPSKRWAGL